MRRILKKSEGCFGVKSWKGSVNEYNFSGMPPNIAIRKGV